MIQINPLKSYIDGGVRAALTTPPSASLVFDLPGKAIWVKGVKLKGTDHTYTFSHDNYITLTNTPDSNESEDIKIGVNTSALKNAIDTTYGVVSTTANGLAPKFTSGNKQAAAAATTYYFLGWAGSTLKWYQAPFRNIRINSETTDCLGVNNTDPLIISSGNGISVTWDSTNKKIIITNTKPDVNHNTDTKVAQSVTTQNKNYAIILKGNDSDEGSITTVNFSTYLKFNPSTKKLTINGSKVITATDTFVGATTSADGSVGLVTKPLIANRLQFLRGDGTWATPIDTWRPVKVEGTEKLGSNALDLSAGNGISIVYNSDTKKIIITNTKPDVNHNTHYTTMLYIGENNDTKANKNVANPYLKLFDDNTRRATFQIKAGNGIAIASDTNGNITITNSSPDVNHNTDITVKQTPKTDNVNRPLMMINGGTSTGEQINTSMFSTGIYANASTKMITANGFIKAGSSDDYVLLGGGNHKALSNFSMSGHTHTDTFSIGYTPNYVALSFRDPALSKKASEKYIECWDSAGGWWNWMAGKWIKAGSDDSYVLLGGGGHKALSDFSMSGHNHDGRYLRWNGSAADISAMGWGTLTTANGYTILSHASSSDGGDVGFTSKNGQIFMQLDGYYYQNEGRCRVLDTSDFTAFSNIGSQTTRITIGGVTKDLKIDADTLDSRHATYFWNYKTPSKSSGDLDVNEVLGDTIAAWAYGFAESTNVIHGPIGDKVSDARAYYTLGGVYCPLQLSWYYNNSASLYARTYYNKKWYSWNKIAFISDIPTVTNYYWADQKISNNSNIATNPTVALLKATTGVQIGSTADYGWYLYNNRVCAGINVARDINTGSLLVSSAWADSSKVPTNGIYSKGNIQTAGGFIKSGSSNSYILLGAGGHKAVSDFATSSHNHDGRYLQYNGWWSSGSGQNVDNANGMVFVYGNHGSPNGWGILCTFDYAYNSGYKFQLFAEGYRAAGMYYRCRSSDRGGWTDWKTVIDSGNIGSQSVAYASSAGNADTVDGLHVHSGRNNEVNKIVRTDASGYIQAGWINTTSGDMGTTAINKIYCSNDSYIRYKTPSNFFSTLVNNGNNISITVAGQNRTLTVGYASNAGYATCAPAAANWGGTGSTTKIKVKINSATSWMLSFVVTLYQGYKATKIMISGYNYGSNYWYEPEAVLLGDSNGATSISVYFGYDSAYNLWVGFDGGSYTGISISDVTNGYTQISSFKGLFTISNVSSLTTLQKTITATNLVYHADYSRYVYCTSGKYLNFQWSGQSGQPTWLFGSNDGANVYVWNPSNFSVNYANSAGNADTVDGQHLMTQVSNWNTDSLSIFKSSENSTSNAPTSDYTYGVTLRFHREASIYHTDLVASLYHDRLFFRRKEDKGYMAWRELLHTGNYSSYALPLSGGRLTGHLWLNAQEASSSTGGRSQLIFGNNGTQHVAISSNTGAIVINPNAGDTTGQLVLRVGASKTSNFAGNINAAHFYENSDIRYKKILRNLSINSNIIANLPLFDFEWIENNAIGTGTSAQAVQQILPNLVSGTDKLTLDYGVLGTIAGITACKELVTQKSELQQLKEKVKQLEDKLSKYENTL